MAHHLEDVLVDLGRRDVAVLDEQVSELLRDDDGVFVPEPGVRGLRSLALSFASWLRPCVSGVVLRSRPRIRTVSGRRWVGTAGGQGVWAELGFLAHGHWLLLRRGWSLGGKLRDVWVSGSEEIEGMEPAAMTIHVVRVGGMHAPRQPLTRDLQRCNCTPKREVARRFMYLVLGNVNAFKVTTSSNLT